MRGREIRPGPRRVESPKHRGSGREGGVVQTLPEPDEPSEVCLGGRRSRRFNPPLEELLSFIDEVEALVRDGREVEGC